ncbi:short-chain dehydrogenase/ reductase [Lipomyces kononenkoae]
MTVGAVLYSQLFVTPKYPTASFKDQTIIVTGSNVGLGFEAARHFVRLYAEKVILAVRNIAAGEKAKQSIEESTGRSNVCEVWELDLSSYASVKAFAERAYKLDRIDVLLENAGINSTDFSLAEGHERTITVNVISTFLLGLLLLPKLRATKNQGFNAWPHWSIVTSEVHAFTNLPEWKCPSTFEALSDEKQANMRARYVTSKLLEILVVREIAPKLAQSGVILNMLNPGFCQSQLIRDERRDWWLVRFLMLVLARTVEVGARTLVAAAAAGHESYGAYMTDGKVNNGALSPFVTSPEGKKAQEKVWSELKEILVNIDPEIAKQL